MTEPTKPKPASKQPNALALAKTGIADEFKNPALIAEVSKVVPRHLTAERLLRVAQTMVLFKPELVACTRDSLRRAVLICAQAGLEPDGRLAHIIAFGNQAQVIFDWKGLVALAARNNIQVVPKLVYTTDKFRVLEDDGEGRTRIEHEVNYDEPSGEIKAVYSRAKMPDGTIDYEIMRADEVEHVRQSFSKAKDSLPWVKSWGEMAKKTVIKRHTKRFDLMPEIRDVLYADDDNLPAKEPKPMLKPIFATPPPEIENGNEPEPPEMPQDEKPPAHTPSHAPKPQEGGKAEQAAGPIAIRLLLKTSKIKESELLAFLTEIGLAEAGTETLEELALQSDTTLARIADQWQDMAARIVEARVPTK